MNGRALRRLAADHSALYSQDLPPGYLFPLGAAHSDDLTQLDILLAGPTHTPFAAGVWKLHLSIPTAYPQQPPTANFRTPIFHPNVDPQTGGVCVETLKRDWDSKLTLRDVLVTISCLLIQPNPDSALNADAGGLIQEDYEAFARRARLMTDIHATVPNALRAAVRDAQNRGQEAQTEDEEESSKKISTEEPPARRRRTIAQVRNMRKVEISTARHDQHAKQGHPFVFQAGNDDVFGTSTPQRGRLDQIDEDGDSSMADGEQENDSFHSPSKLTAPMPVMTPRRPHGVAVPLGELIMEQEDTEDLSEDMEHEYPPSPRKSPSKSPPKRRPVRTYDVRANMERPESSRGAVLRGSNITPPNFNSKPLAEDSPFMDVTFEDSSLPHTGRQRGLFDTPPKRPSRDLFGKMRRTSPVRESFSGVGKDKSPSSAEQRHGREQERATLDAKLWSLCGGDIQRWNRGDFDGEPFKKKAGRW